mgnify:CR=1 FL=1|tara:strand:+ start:1835 stop:2089 length:255 start_codon:yes stop_codon:yes gene_type:complete
MPKKTGCGANSNGTQTPNACFRKGIGVGYKIASKPKPKKKLTRADLTAYKKGGLEDLAKRKFQIKNARKKTKADLITEILAKQK